MAKRKRKNKIIEISLVLVIIILSLMIITPSFQAEKISSKFITGENTGFDLTPGELNFGKIIPGSSATRSISITNTQNYPTKTTIKSYGEITPYMIVSENNFLLQPSQSKNITFTVYPDKDLEYKEFIGEIKIITKKS